MKKPTFSSEDLFAMETRLAKGRRDRAKADLYEIDNQTPNTIIEQNPCHESMAKAARKKGNPVRFHVLVVSYRRRLCDTDNLCPKYFIDCLKYSQLIPDDSPKFIELETRQIQVKNRFEERTEIMINEITNDVDYDG